MSTKEFDFRPDDVVSFCGENATVVENHGDYGIVRIDREFTSKWYWMFDGEKVELVSRPTSSQSSLLEEARERLKVNLGLLHRAKLGKFVSRTIAEDIEKEISVIEDFLKRSKEGQ